MIKDYTKLRDWEVVRSAQAGWPAAIQEAKRRGLMIHAPKPSDLGWFWASDRKFRKQQGI